MSKLVLNESAAPSQPAAGKVAIYADVTANPQVRFKDDANNDIQQLDQRNTVAQTGNKDFADGTTTISNVSLSSKAVKFSLAGMTAAVILTLLSAQSTSQTLTIPNITGADTLVTLGLAQSITGVKTMTNMTTLAGTTGVASMTIGNGTNLTTAAANAVENDGVAATITIDTTNGRGLFGGLHAFRLTANGSGITSIADAFGANSAVPMIAAGKYQIDWYVWTVQTTSGGTYTWTITLSAAATLAHAQYICSPIGGIATAGTPQTAGILNVTATTALPATGTQAVANHRTHVQAIVEASGAANIRLRLTVSAGTATPQKESYYTVRRLAAGNTGAFAA